MGSKRKSRKRSLSRRRRDRSISSVTNSSTDSDRNFDHKSRHRNRVKNTKHAHSRKHHKSTRKIRKRDRTPPLPLLQDAIIQQNDSASQASESAAQNGSSATATYEAGSSLGSVPCFPIHPNMMNNVVPEFDPSDSTQSIETWIHKVNECSKIYNWNDTQICHFALPKLSGLAKRWYQGLPSLMFTWDEWKNKLQLAFPSNENYGDLLTKMLKIRCKFGQPLDVYYYDKMALLNKCEITGSKAVGCLVHGIEDKFIRMGASAGRFSDPEQLFSYLRQITVSQGFEQSQPSIRSRSTMYRPARADQVTTGDPQKQIKCFNCGDIGHISLKCPKPVKKCSGCNMWGHLVKDCRRRPSNFSHGTTIQTRKDDTTGVSKNVMSITSNKNENAKYYKTVKVNGTELTAFIDFGSCSTLIREVDAKSLFGSWSLGNVTPLKGFGNSPVLPLGTKRAWIELDTVSAEVDMLIVSDHLMPCSVIIGQTFTEKPNFIVHKTKETLIFFEGPNLECENETIKRDLVTQDDIKIEALTTRLVDVMTESSSDCSLYVSGGYRNLNNGQTYVVIPGLYNFVRGLGTVLVSNLGNVEIELTKGLLLARAFSYKEINDNFVSSIDSVSDIEPLNFETIKVGIELNETEDLQFRSLLNKYRDCFALNLSELGKTDIAEMKIELTDKTPVVYNPYRMPRTERDKLSVIIEDLLENGIIRESSSSYASPVILVNKKNGEKRLCVDYRQLNRKTLKDKYPLPRIEDQLDSLGENNLFTSLDLASGYYQVPVAEQSKYLTAFVTPDGLFEYNRMPFGLTNAPSVFQRTINTMLKGQKGLALAFMDDLLIPSKDIKEGMAKLERVFMLLRGAKLTLNLSKCRFFETKIDYLGYEISSEGIRPGTHKIEAVKSFPEPRNVHEIRQFVGLASYFRRFIKGFSLLAQPLTSLTKKNEPWNFGESQRRAFNDLKEKLISRPVLALYNPNATLELHTDASKLGVGAILFQRDEKSQLKPIAYFSRQTSPEEQKFHSYELETLALVAALQKFRVYLLGNKFNVVTDCSAVRSTMMKRDLLPRVARWWISMQEYDFNIEFRPGTRMAHVDALSRCPVEREVASIADTIFRIDDDSAWLETVQQADSEIVRMMEIVKDPAMDRAVDIKNNYTVKSNRLYRIKKTNDVTTLLWVVPKSVRWQILRMNHDEVGHFGFDKTYDRVRKVYWFKDMRRFVAKYCQSCLSCAHNKLPGGAKEGMMHPIPKVNKPFDTLHADHCGPFPTRKKNNCYIIAIIDSFTKFIFVKAVRNTQSKTTINVFEEYFSIFGVPRRLITDRGSSFTSGVFKKFASEKGIKHILNSVATPRANGQIERYNRTLVDAISAAAYSLPENEWDTVIQKVQWGLNNTVNKTTGRSAAEVLYGIEPTGAADGIMNSVVANAHDFNDRESVRIDVEHRTRKEQAKQKERFDKARKEARCYNLGDLVRVERDVGCNVPGQSKKLSPKCYGPYRVIRVLGCDRYEVEDTPITKKEGKPLYKGVFPVDKIFPWTTFANDLVDDE